MSLKKHSVNTWRGTGGAVAPFSLSENVKNEIIKLFKSKKIDNESEFFSKIEEGIRNYLFFSKMSEEYPTERVFDDIVMLNETAESFLDKLKTSNQQAFSMVNIGYYDSVGDISYPIDKLKEMLEDFVLASENIIESKRKYRGAVHTTINTVTRAVTTALECDASGYAVNEKTNGKLFQIMKILIRELDYSGKSSGVVENFIKEHY